MDFKKEMENRTARANNCILSLLPENISSPGHLAEAMRYSVTAGGKRIRPVLMRESFEILGGTGEEIDYFCAAMEFIHTSSLIHDDLPAIDNDALRRGVPTTHAKFGEPLGILSGDALLNYAYETLFKGIAIAGSRENAVHAAQIIAEKTGFDGMLGGQSVDVENEKDGLEIDQTEMLRYIYKKKTSALIEASLMAGGALAGANDSVIDTLEAVGERLGLAFQIRDDILDVTSTSEELGKPICSDQENGKVTYVSLLGLDEAGEKVRLLTEEAVELMNGLPGDTAFLKELFLWLASRRK